jgi:Spy/CpxP family protein refolding chaperone
MKKALICFIGCLLLAYSWGIALAEEEAPAEPDQPKAKKVKRHKRTDEEKSRRMAVPGGLRELDLTAEQKQNVLKIHSEFRDEFLKIREQKKELIKQMRELKGKEEQLQHDMDARLEEILTHEQNEKFKQFREDRKKKMRSRIQERRSTEAEAEEEAESE